LIIDWSDRRLGAQQQHVTNDVGDFVLQRSDGLWAYQLAVVVDDAAQGVIHVVRGEDLADNTPRQIGLQRCLGLPTPRYRHTPLVRDAQGEKLSKQTGAPAVAVERPVEVLRAAAAALGLAVPWCADVNAVLQASLVAWVAQGGGPQLVA
jgi:glutamyl-Q tRNA(Asp) synthetase